MIDTLRITRRLTDAGLERRQAEAIASVMHDLFGQSSATRAGLRLTAPELSDALGKTKVHLVASQLVVSVALFFALKFIH